MRGSEADKDIAYFHQTFIIKLIFMSIYRIFIIEDHEISFFSRENRGKHAENMFSTLHRDDIEYYRSSHTGRM